MASGNQNPAPTGCYKCGRPGHWSRDCPSSRGSSSAAASDAAASTNPSSSGGNWKSSTSNGGAWKPGKTPKPAAPLRPRIRRKLTPDLLLSNEGLGYVLENFPRMVKIQGPGHEVEDLKSLLDAYVHWHSRILPFFSFNQFVEKVEKLGSVKRVRICVNELKDKVSRGENPKLAGDDTNQDCIGDEIDTQGNQNHETCVVQNADAPQVGQNLGMDSWEHETCEEHYDEALPADIHEDLFDEFYKGAIDEDPACPRTTQPMAGLVQLEVGSDAPGNNSTTPKSVSEDKKARMEANRLKALERAKARAATVFTE